jgi:GMP synthase-like glutamine amidotransferase
MRSILLLLGWFVFATQASDRPKSLLVVNSTEDRNSREGQQFIPLIHSVPGWQNADVRLLWVGDLTPALFQSDSKPQAIFLSGSFKDWCEVQREHWAGVEKLLKKKSIPIWASCGGAQALAILSETGTQKEWDCPHCRDPRAPRTPIYTHLGHHTPGKPCGDYSGCIFETGPTRVRVVRRDPVFDGLFDEFQVMESHCGQIAWPPRGWELIATAGQGSLTRVQCIKRRGAPIYAAQFHIEMTGTPESSYHIMCNFLAEVDRWWK